MDGDTNKAKDLLHLSQSCASVEALIYTVSESAGSLYNRYPEAQHQVLGDLQVVEQRCGDALKKKNSEKN